jgi:hypothetical protein
MVPGYYHHRPGRSLSPRKLACGDCKDTHCLGGPPISKAFTPWKPRYSKPGTVSHTPLRLNDLTATGLQILTAQELPKLLQTELKKGSRAAGKRPARETTPEKSSDEDVLVPGTPPTAAGESQGGTTITLAIRTLERLRTGADLAPKQRQRVSPPLSTMLPGKYRHLQHPGLGQAETGLKRKRAGTAKYRQRRERMGILRQFALASLEICSYTHSQNVVRRDIGRAVIQFSMRLRHCALDNRMCLLLRAADRYVVHRMEATALTIFLPAFLPPRHLFNWPCLAEPSPA